MEGVPSRRAYTLECAVKQFHLLRIICICINIALCRPKSSILSAQKRKHPTVAPNGLSTTALTVPSTPSSARWEPVVSPCVSSSTGSRTLRGMEGGSCIVANSTVLNMNFTKAKTQMVMKTSRGRHQKKGAAGVRAFRLLVRVSTRNGVTRISAGEMRAIR